MICGRLPLANGGIGSTAEAHDTYDLQGREIPTNGTVTISGASPAWTTIAGDVTQPKNRVITGGLPVVAGDTSYVPLDLAGAGVTGVLPTDSIAPGGVAGQVLTIDAHGQASWAQLPIANGGTGEIQPETPWHELTSDPYYGQILIVCGSLMMAVLIAVLVYGAATSRKRKRWRGHRVDPEVYAAIEEAEAYCANEPQIFVSGLGEVEPTTWAMAGDRDDYGDPRASKP